MAERQFNFPRRQQRSVVSGRGNFPVFAINIGSLSAASHPLTGATTGVAGMFAISGDDLVITDERRHFLRRDASGIIDDGTLIQLDMVSGKLTIVWADCSSHEALEGLEAAP